MVIFDELSKIVQEREVNAENTALCCAKLFEGIVEMVQKIGMQPEEIRNLPSLQTPKEQEARELFRDVVIATLMKLENLEKKIRGE